MLLQKGLLSQNTLSFFVFWGGEKSIVFLSKNAFLEDNTLLKLDGAN
jgi:hypothetical protein